MNDLPAYCLDLARRAKSGGGRNGPGQRRHKSNDWLRGLARLLAERSAALAEANRLDLAAAAGYGLSEAQIDRLRLTPARIAAMATAMEEVAALPEPIGEVISSSIRPNGLEVQKVRVPLGVIFFIYESRPNVTTDAAAICVKSGNAVILRGGKEAAHSNAAIAEILAEAAAEAGLPADAVQLVATPDRAAVGHLLRMPRVHQRGHSPRRRKPDPPREPRRPRCRCIKHFAGNCHVYFDRSADADMAETWWSTPSASGWASATRPSRCWCTPTRPPRLLPRVGEALIGTRRRDPRRRAHAAMRARRPSRPPRRIIAPSIWAR